MKMRVHLIACDIQRNDAIGNFCRQIYAFLDERGYDVALVAENCVPDDRSLVSPLSEITPKIAVNDVIIFHFSTEDPAFPLIAAVDNPKILYFHNITPESFFRGIDERSAHLAKLGLEQRSLAAKFDLLMANSRATARVLHEGLVAADRGHIGEDDIIICPPVIGIDRWASIAEQAAAIDVNSRTILYVGRPAPHKGVAQLIEGFALLAAKDASVRLVCVGGSFESPDASAVRERIAALEPGVARRIQLLHGISDGALKSIYKSVGVCASMSRHEGFGVPLVDALAFGKPLVINAEAGMMETAGEAAIIVDASHPEAVAGALGAALDNDATRDRLAVARRLRLETLRYLTDGHLILDAVNQARGLHRARSV